MAPAPRSLRCRWYDNDLLLLPNLIGGEEATFYTPLRTTFGRCSLA